MPELPQPKAWPYPKANPDASEVLGGARALAFHPYAELQVTSNFTFLTGASHPDELVQQAAALGYRAIAITDTNSLAGIVRAHIAAKETGIPLAIGCRLRFIQPEGLSILVYPTDRRAYARLCRLLTLGKRRAPKGECHLWLHDLIDHHHGLLAVAIPPAVIDQDFIDVLLGLKTHFDDDRLSLAASHLYGPDDELRLSQLQSLSEYTGVPLVATNDVHYHTPARRALQDVITCIKHGCTIDQAGLRLFANAERHLKTPQEMACLFASCDGAVERSVTIANRAAAFSLDELRYQYPDEVVPPDKTPMQHLIDLTWQGAAKHYPANSGGVPDKVRNLIEHEFKLIEELNFAPYFLTVHDLVVQARTLGILCQGRGAAANSAVCYCLGVTAVDPDRIDMLFERFVSKERNEPPDIDIDFEHERREEVIQYIYGKYGRDRAALTAEVITYRGRSAVREVGKALGLSLDCVDRLAKSTDWWFNGVTDPAWLRELGLNPDDPTIRRLMELATELLGFPRHLSQHVGGFVITRGPLCELVPVENAAMPDRTMIEWDKDDIDAMGMLKVDVLGLGMLTCISKAFALVNERHEGTKARRHEGENSVASQLDERMIEDESADSDVSRFDCVAESNGACQDDVSSHENHAQERRVRTDAPNEARIGVSAIEHRGGLCAPEHARLHQVPTHSPRITGGTGDATCTGNRSRNAEAESVDQRSSGGNGSCASGPHPQSPEETSAEITSNDSFENGIGTFDPKRNLVLASLYDPYARDHSCKKTLSDPPSCLRASVPSCLPSPPPHPFPLELHNVPPEDPAVYDMICHADTIGVFQIESRAQMSMLPRLRPQKFYDLVIEVAIVRPGPIQGDMVHPYLRRRNKEEDEFYPNEEVRRVLGKTLGVPLFQEQAMNLAIVAAGFTPGEADQLRRAIAAWKTKGNQIAKFGERLMNGMIERGYDPKFAHRCFEQIKGFSGYGFPESHAASFALLVYVSSWLKKHYPAEFAAALINSQPMGFYAPAQIVRDAQEHGVTVLPVDVNRSEWDCTIEQRHEGTEAPPERHEVACLRLGLRLIRGLSETDATSITDAVKRCGPFQSIEALRRTSGVRVSVLRRLAGADAFNSMVLDRQHALWQVRALRDEKLPMFDQADIPAHSALSTQHSALPPIPDLRRVAHDYAATGLSLRPHPVSFIRDKLTSLGAMPTGQLKDESRWPHGKQIVVAGLTLVRQRPSTANGIVFMTIEDETGIANLIIRPDVYARCRKAARHGVVVLARGRVERQGEVVHVLAFDIKDVSLDTVDLDTRSRDFH